SDHNNRTPEKQGAWEARYREVLGILLRGGEFKPVTPASQSLARTDLNSLTAHTQLLEKTRKGAIDIYFEGDSITRRWGATDYPALLANWNQNFHGWNAADFEIGRASCRERVWIWVVAVEFI